MNLECKVHCQVLTLLIWSTAFRMLLAGLHRRQKVKIHSSSPKITKQREKVCGFRIMDTEFL